MLSVSHRMLPIRAAGTASLLVRSEALRSCGPRSGLPADAATLEWTARLLRDAVGYLVPTSVAEAVPTPSSVGVERWLDRDLLDDLRIGAAMLSSRGWHPKEKLWLAPEVLGGSVRAVWNRWARSV